MGFMDNMQAIAHLQNACVPLNPDPSLLTAEWQAAKAQLGASPVQNAGRPNIAPIDPRHATHIATVLNQPIFQFGGNLLGTSCMMVEIEPLLAFQFTVDLDRSNHHCGVINSPPTVDELLNLCLPLTPPNEDIKTTPGANSFLLRARSLNVRSFNVGMFTPPNIGHFIGMQFGVSLPYVHVVRHNGRCYLHNGFHRTVGARLAGATHVPCLFRDVPDHQAVGIHEGTFPAQLMESNDPPTVAHFTQGRAQAVNLRAHSRVLHVSWAEYSVPDE